MMLVTKIKATMVRLIIARLSREKRRSDARRGETAFSSLMPSACRSSCACVERWVGLSEAGPRSLILAVVGGMGGTPSPVLLNISTRFGVSVVSADLSSICICLSPCPDCTAGLCSVRRSLVSPDVARVISPDARRGRAVEALLSLDARVGEAVGDVGHEVHEDDRRGEQDGDALDDGEIAIADGGDRFLADAGDVE